MSYNISSRCSLLKKTKSFDNLYTNPNRRLLFGQYIKELTNSINIDTRYSEHHILNKKINLCFSAGGFSSAYGFGIVGYLFELIKANKLEINHIYCSSSGSILGIYILLFLNTHSDYHLTDYLLMSIYNIYEDINDEKKIMDIVADYLEHVSIPNLYEICNNKLFIGVHYINNYYIPQFKIISKFNSNKDLIGCIRASGTIPYITSVNFFNYVNDHDLDKKLCCFDGIFTQIKDPSLDTLYINLGQLNYSLIDKLSASDRCIERLVIKGIYDIDLLINKTKSNRSLYIISSTNNKNIISFNYFNFFISCFVNIINLTYTKIRSFFNKLNLLYSQTQIKYKSQLA